MSKVKLAAAPISSLLIAINCALKFLGNSDYHCGRCLCTSKVEQRGVWTLSDAILCKCKDIETHEPS